MEDTRGRPKVGYQIHQARRQAATASSDNLKEIPEPDQSLSKYAKGWWVYLCELKLAEQDLREQWLPLIQTLAKTFEDEAQLEYEISRDGRIVYDTSGKPYANPAVAMLKSTRSSLVMYLDRLNLTPQAASRVKTSSKKPIFSEPTSVPAGSVSHATALAVPVPGLR
jgi:phage terminase small subunit